MIRNPALRYLIPELTAHEVQADFILSLRL